ncbi:RNA polymerase II transcription factor B subunit 4 [Ascosphaera pollenicola]|nr:RNA polymerase II transcription factor B subunit 4 [Ascosphaera pollenicola]
MNSIDASEHYDASSSTASSSLLTIVLDTNPYAWSQLSDSLPLSAAVANLLIFINAHLACDYTNRVAVVASHYRHATWLYPTPVEKTSIGDEPAENDENDDEATKKFSDASSNSTTRYKYPPFAQVEHQISRNLKRLLSQTPAKDVKSSASTKMAGALTLALSHINRETIAYAEANGTSRPEDADAAGKALPPDIAASNGGPTTANGGVPTGLQSRILVVSVSPTTDAAHQYIPLMNTIFACQRLHIPIDIAVLSGHPVFLQQAADATGGVYMPITPPTGFLEYLLLAYLPDATLRRKTLRTPSQVDVDFRAACFCHRKVIDVGYVCSVCLSIFCEPPPAPTQPTTPAASEPVTAMPRKRPRESGTVAPQTTSACLTCGTVLSLEAEYGLKPAVLPRKKKKRRTAATASAAASKPPSTALTPKKEG